VQGKTEAAANAMVAQATAIQDAGAQLLVLECVPTAVAERITAALRIPVIGIGAGNVTDGQVLVMHDLLGISSGYIPKFSKNYLAQTGDIRSAIASFVSEVKSQTFPSDEHSF
ncbi:MAG: 3-methyl-2-oxobutanoate hydroxymethyltransferase, partial [Rheinheimera sp.]|nr:3-methyl-2-oxobutanoate hydroxymethyltransferase [Rheinheimera sp.]